MGYILRTHMNECTLLNNVVNETRSNPLSKNTNTQKLGASSGVSYCYDNVLYSLHLLSLEFCGAP
jgi:hypothetical protein